MRIKTAILTCLAVLTCCGPVFSRVLLVDDYVERDENGYPLEYQERQRFYQRWGVYNFDSDVWSIDIQGMVDSSAIINYDAVVFVGGGGTPIIRKEVAALKIARETLVAGKVLAAICWAPTILAKAGVLRGKRATVWEGPDAEYGKNTSEVLVDFGAQYVPEGCVVDGRIVTADGPATAEEMAAEIAKLLG